MRAAPKRYEAKSQLGQGGGGEVWRVYDRVRGETVALKILAKDAGDQEAIALVREAVTLSSLEGLGLPRVLAFGSIAEDGRRYMVRELVEGESLEELFARATKSPWLLGLVQASEQLTILHRSGILHGDIKPANIIVGESGDATLVDLGLSAKFKEGGVAPEGLTPRFAAPELLHGEPLTVRAEVFSLGKTLEEGLRESSRSLAYETIVALTQISQRATEADPAKRFPSVDEFAAAIRSAAGFSPSHAFSTKPWRVIGLDATAARLLGDIESMAKGGVLLVEGAKGAGRSTLLRRIGWSLGISGKRVCILEIPAGPLSLEEAFSLELEALGNEGEGIIVADDVDQFPKELLKLLSARIENGAKLVCTASALPKVFDKESARSFVVPPLEAAAFRELVTSAIPSIPEALIHHLEQRTERSPSKLRDVVVRVGDQPLVSVDSLDADAIEGKPRSRAESLAALERALATGHFDKADRLIGDLGAGTNPAEKLKLAIAKGRLMLARGDGKLTLQAIEGAPTSTLTDDEKTSLDVLKGRALVRLGDFAAAAETLQRATSSTHKGSISSEAFAVRGIAFAYLGDDTKAKDLLETAVRLAHASNDPRACAIATGSMAIAHQRAGRQSEARDAYASSLAFAEQAGDAWTIAATRVNLAGLAQGAGDFAEAFVHLEAAVDLGLRAGGLLAVQQAKLNLANLNIFVGRFARASAALEGLANNRDQLTSSAKAQLLGLEAELASRTGNDAEAALLFDRSADAYETIARPLDAAEVRFEAILHRSRLSSESPQQLLEQVEAAKEKAGESALGEHEALFHMVKASVLARLNRENEAKEEFDLALSLAKERAQTEWAWRVLQARGQIHSASGSVLRGRKDVEEALSLLEETASKLPRDLREVFWSTPQRRSLREANAATIIGTTAVSIRHDSSGDTSTLPTEDRLARIFEITRELAREHDVQRLLQRVTDHAVALVAAERGIVVLIGEDGELSISTSRDARGEESHAKFSRSVAERVIQSGEPVVVSSAQEDERVAHAVSVHQLMIQSIACVPIRGAPPVGRPIGALYVETRLRPGSRFKKELPTLLAFADQAAIAIENARLLQENTNRTEQLKEANRSLARAQEKLEEALGRRTEQLQRTRQDLKQVRAEIGSHFGYSKLVGTSAPMRRLYSLIERVKDTDVPLLVVGESGTGKEVVAQTIHRSGARAKAPFLGVNCGAIPANLLEGELFGHVKGAFTGADKDRSGLFREASGGTLLLDEIGEMPLSMQAGLLRVLQERKVRPVGATTEQPIDTRVIAATNRNLAKMVEEGTFREDLYYRLNVIEIAIPSLRDRPEDIPPLIDHFLNLFSVKHRRERKTIHRDALRRLTSYHWPGNVRQLEHVLLNAWLMSDASEIASDDISLPQKSPSETRASARPSRSSDEFEGDEKKRILEALDRAGWNRAKAAQLCGLPRRTFYRRLKDYGIL